MTTAASITRHAEAAERACDWDAAASLYGALFDEGRHSRDVLCMVNAIRRAGVVRFAQARYDEAEDLARLSLEVAERNGLGEGAARAINVLAMLRHRHGDLDGARALYEDALDRGRHLRDDPLIGVACQNLGVVENTKGNLRAARLFYLESVAMALRSGDMTGMIRAYNNLGMVCADLEEWMEAEIYFSRGTELAQQTGDARLLSLLSANRAEPLIHVGNLAGARAVLDQAEKISAQLLDWRSLAEVARFRAVIARREGDMAAAEQEAARALLFAAKAEAVLEQAEALEELAHIRWEQKRGLEAVETLRRARLALQTLGADRDVERLERLVEVWEAPDLVGSWAVPGTVAGTSTLN